MKNLSVLLVMAPMLMGCDVLQQSTANSIVLVQNEQTFAADVGQSGMRDGFLAHIADDGVLFMPQAVNGKAHYEAQERQPGYLTWFPIYAEISSGGDFGWTTGPWEWRSDESDSLPQVSGQYNTVWVLQPDSTWKFVFDMGISHSPHLSTPPLATRVLVQPTAGDDLKADEAIIELVRLETTFASKSVAEGLVAAYGERMAADIRYHRDGEFPIVGASDVPQALSQIGDMTWDVLHAEVAKAGDLAYTYGVSRLINTKEPTRFSYGRIWRRGDDGEWQLALDIHIPLPPSEPAEEGVGG